MNQFSFNLGLMMNTIELYTTVQLYGSFSDLELDLRSVLQEVENFSAQFFFQNFQPVWMKLWR